MSTAHDELSIPLRGRWSKQKTASLLVPRKCAIATKKTLDTNPTRAHFTGAYLVSMREHQISVERTDQQPCDHHAQLIQVTSELGSVVTERHTLTTEPHGKAGTLHHALGRDHATKTHPSTAMLDVLHKS